MRTAESVVFTCCPPEPEDLFVSTFNTAELRFIFVGLWSLGSTATVAVDVWTRPLDSEDGIRWMRWTPASVMASRLTFVPTISAEAAFKWPFDPRLASKSLNVQFILMEKRSYIRNNSEVNAHASEPPTPALTSSQTEEISAAGEAFAESLHGLKAIIYLSVGCKLHSATASNVIRVKSVPPKAVWIAQKMAPGDAKIVLNQSPHTADETLSNGQITVIAAGSTLERKAERAFAISCGQVPRERAQEFGFKTAESFASVSLCGPQGTLERRRRISVTQTALCLRAADSS